MGATNWGVMQYSLDNINWSTNAPVGINALTYNVYYRVVGDENINDVNPVMFEVTISPKVISSPVIELS